MGSKIIKILLLCSLPLWATGQTPGVGINKIDTSLNITIGSSLVKFKSQPYYNTTFATKAFATALSNGKEPAIAAGTALQYWRGDKTFQILNTSVVPEGTNLYYTDARVNALITVKENTANKQNSLTTDGTGIKFPTVDAVNTGLTLKSNIASPTFTGTPLAPTAALGTNTTQIATMAALQAAISNALPTLVEVSTTTQALLVNRTYIVHTTTLTILTLPATNPSIGSLITIIGDGSGMFRVAQNANQFIVSGNATSTVGTGGWIQTNSANTAVTLRYLNTNKWSVTSSNSTPTIQ